MEAKTLAPFIPLHLRADASNRITLTESVSERISWMKGTNPQGWLLLVGPGRYRLLSDEQVQNHPQLESVRQLILEGPPEAVTEPMHAEELKDAAIVARLVPISFARTKPGWRISLPKELKAFVPPDCNPKAL